MCRFCSGGAGWGGVGGRGRKGMPCLEVMRSDACHFQADTLGAELWFTTLSFLFAVRLAVF